uniref:Oxidation resistance protein 1 n=1 Tax=Romanomermis culicivorax TaxID=13658 RepID=A0A915K3W5_ROMCU
MYPAVQGHAIQLIIPVTTHFDPLSDYGHEENVRRRSLVFTRESRTLSPLVIKRKLTNSIQKLRDTWRSSEFSDIQEGKVSNVAGPPPLLRVASRHSSSVDDNEERTDRTPPMLNDNDGLMVSDDQEALSDKVSFDALHDHFLAMESYVKKTMDLRRNLPRFYDAMQKLEKIQLGEQIVSPSISGNNSSSKFYPYAYYLLIRLKSSKNCKQNNGADTNSEESPPTTVFSREIWFSIPHERIDVLYLLFLQWCVEEPSDSSVETTSELQDTVNSSVKFIVIDDAKYAEKPTVSDIPLFTNPYQFTSDTHSQESILLDRNNIKLIWQLLRLDEFQRRFSLSGLTETYFLPLPEGSSRSTLLNENLTRRLVGVLPARAQIYPWVLIYSSHEHGFSLRTMYNRMSRWHEDQSPTLLIVKDDNGRVFGAVLSCTLKVDEHFYGSGESLLFTDFPSFKTFRWTGANTFVVICALDSLAIGAGKDNQLKHEVMKAIKD